MAKWVEALFEKVQDKKAKIGIIGVGYVGLPLALAFAKKFTVVGYDSNRATVENLLQGKSHIWDVTDEEVIRYLNKAFHPTTQETELADCDFIIICVPTPLTPQKEPDLSRIKASAEIVSSLLKKGQFVILESTTYPGTTEEVLIPILERSGLKAGIGFGVAYSLERIDPGNKNYTLENTPKMAAGITPECTDIAAALYNNITNTVIKVRDCKTAEACKILENVFRSVNIALVNEMALIFEKMNIDAWEVIAAAATKPYGFMPFYPGAGVGGHCIPLDPYYMAYKARRCDIIPRFIELSGEINDFMRMHTINLVEKGLMNVDKRMSQSQIAVLGLAYKKEFDDTRESPAIKIIEEIINLGGNVKVYDPYVKSIDTASGRFASENSLEDTLKDVDCALFLVDHNQFREIEVERLKVLMRYPVVIDCKNIFDTARMEGFIYLAIGKPGNIAKY